MCDYGHYIMRRLWTINEVIEFGILVYGIRLRVFGKFGVDFK